MPGSHKLGTDLLHFATPEQSEAQLDSWPWVRNYLFCFDNLLQRESKLVFPVRSSHLPNSTQGKQTP